MKGTLHKLTKGWTVWYNEDPIGGNMSFVDSLPLHPRDLDSEIIRWANNGSLENKEVEFDMVKEYIDLHTNQVQAYAKLKLPIPELLHRDGTPMRSYSSPKIQELLDEIKLEEITDEEIQKEAQSQATFAPSFIRGVEWYKEQLKKGRK